MSRRERNFRSARIAGNDGKRRAGIGLSHEGGDKEGEHKARQILH